MIRIVTLGLVSVLFLPGARAQDKEKSDAKYVLKVDGKLTDDDQKIKIVMDSPYKNHMVKLAPGHYIVDLASDDFDAFLRLFNPDGKKVAEDDDSGGGPRGLNARLGYKVEKAGEYKLMAAALDIETGAYQLTVKQATPEDIAKLDPYYELIGKPAPEV